MDKKIEEMDESMQAMQRRLDEIENSTEETSSPDKKSKLPDIDRGGMNPAAMAGAAGGTAGLGTDKNSGGDLGAPTGEGVNGHVGGTGTETPA